MKRALGVMLPVFLGLICTTGLYVAIRYVPRIPYALGHYRPKQACESIQPGMTLFEAQANAAAKLVPSSVSLQPGNLELMFKRDVCSIGFDATSGRVQSVRFSADAIQADSIAWGGAIRGDSR